MRLRHDLEAAASGVQHPAHVRLIEIGPFGKQRCGVLCVQRVQKRFQGFEFSANAALVASLCTERLFKVLTASVLG